MITALLFILILVVLVLIHEFGHYYAAKRMGVYVEEFGFGFPPRVIGKKIGETLYSWNLIPLGGFVKLFGEEYHEASSKKAETASDAARKSIPASRAFVNKKPWQKTVIIVAGVVMNFILGWAIISYLFTSGVPVPNGVKITNVAAGSPAHTVGLEAQDVVKELIYNNVSTEIQTSQVLISTTQSYIDKEITVVVSRGEEQLEFDVIPRSNPPKGEGSLGIVIEQMLEVKKYPWYSAPYYGLIHAFKTTSSIAIEIIKIPAGFIMQKQTSVDFAGPVGIAKVIGEARKYGISALLEITAILSLNLAVVNILPFPALDGGRLVFIIYEWVSGRKPNQNLERYMNMVGIVLLLALSVLITIYDIQKYWGT
ncbi:MAG: M50 family metallopeptidase [bacterium]|nr:M50 family metallopeptidase [bacterium]